MLKDSLATKASINDSSTTSTTATWSANKINSALANKANAVDVISNSSTIYGSNSVNFTTAFRSAFNDISAGRSKLVYLTSNDKANCTGLFIKISSVWGIFIGATQDGKMFARYTVDGGTNINTINTFA